MGGREPPEPEEHEELESSGTDQPLAKDQPQELVRVARDDAGMPSERRLKKSNRRASRTEEDGTNPFEEDSSSPSEEKGYRLLSKITVTVGKVTALVVTVTGALVAANALVEQVDKIF